MPEGYRVFVNDRNTSVLFVSVLIGPAILTRYEFPLSSPALR
jgi:hypothetical protein